MGGDARGQKAYQCFIFHRLALKRAKTMPFSEGVNEKPLELAIFSSFAFAERLSGECVKLGIRIAVTWNSQDRSTKIPFHEVGKGLELASGSYWEMV